MLEISMRRPRAFHFFQNVFYSIHLSIVSQSRLFGKGEREIRDYYREGLFGGEHGGRKGNYRLRMNVFMNLNCYFPLNIKFYG